MPDIMTERHAGADEAVVAEVEDFLAKMQQRAALKGKRFTLPTYKPILGFRHNSERMVRP